MKNNTFSIIIFVFLTLPIAIFSQSISRTMTIDPVQLNSIRLAATQAGYDPLIQQYWNQYSQTTRDEEPDLMLGDRSFTNTFGLETRAIRLYSRIISNASPSAGGDYSINSIRDYLYNFPWETYQRALHHPEIPDNVPQTPIAGETIPSDWDTSTTDNDPAWYNLRSYNRARELSYNMLFLSFMVDMLYYAHDLSDVGSVAKMDTILAKLNSHIHWAYNNFFDYSNWTNLGWQKTPTTSHPMGMCYDWVGNDETDNPYVMPSIGNDSNRMIIVSGIGYGAIVTGILYPNNVDFSNSGSLINFVKNEFKSDFELPAGTGNYGMNDYYITNSGMYHGGITYQNRVLYLSPLFFTALNRVYFINLYNSNNQWNCDIIPKMVKNVLVRIDPELQHITQEDDYRYDGVTQSGGNNLLYDHSRQIERGLLCYYYQNSDDYDTRNNVRWYVQRLLAKNGGIVYPREVWEHDFKSSFCVVISYDEDRIPIDSGASIPSYYANGTYSNSELTILRKPILSTAEFSSSRMLTVNHENSFTFSHRNDDKTAFQLYLDGKPIIIENGYAPAYNWYKWFSSSFSQNVLLINPDLPTNATSYLSEDDYLSIPYNQDSPDEIAKIIKQDPTSEMNIENWALYPENDEFYNPARKQYLFSNNHITHLNVAVKYNNSVSTSYVPSNPSTHNNHPCRVERNFYSFNDEYFIVMDRVKQELVYPNIYRNQIHFLEDLPDQYVLSEQPDLTGAFRFQFPSNTLFISMGSTAEVNSYNIRNGLPIGWRWWDNYFDPNTGDYTLQKRQQRLSFVTNPSTNVDEYFVTLLYPSDAISPCPITETVNSAGAYGVIAQKPTSNVISAINSSDGVNFPISNYRMMTNSKFFVIEASNEFSSVASLVIYDGNSMIVRDLTGTRFQDKCLFLSDYNGFDEAVAEWHNSSLSVTIRAQNPISPRYKILRCGVLPEHFNSSTEFGTEAYSLIDTTSCSRGIIQNNIQYLAYDADYFYVNYTWYDLLAAGLVDDNLVIVKATIPELALNTDLNIQGFVSIIGSITINNGASMDVYPNSSMLVSDGVGISNHGALNISGGASRTVSIGSASQQWSGIITYRDGSLICDGAVVTGANTGIQIRGNSTISNSEISDCHQGISIETGTPFSIDGSLIQNNTYGIVISNNYTTSDLGHIQNNEITQNGIGMLLYNSNTKIALNDIHNNTRAGLYLVRGSEPIVKGCNISFTEQNGLSRPEIRLESDSYPIIDDARNDINADGLGYSLFYDSTGRIKQLMARNNYWGSTNPFGIRQWMYPLDWDVVYDPYSTEPNTFFPHVYDNLFKQALAAEESGDTALAKQLYSTIVATEPDSLYSLQSLGRLNSIYSGSPSLLGELRTLYDAYLVACDDSILVKNAQIKSVMIDRFDGLFLQALQEYDLQLHLSTTELDSLLCLLDIAYTLEDMYYDDLGKGSYSGLTYLANGLNITSLKDARQTVQQLWGEILAKSDNSTSDNVPVPTKLDVTNYPNPFNPSTTIAFSLPDEGIVRLSVYNIRGQWVRDLLSGSLPRGFHKVVWDGKDNGNRSVSSGLYFVRIETGKTSSVRKIMMLK